ncbi:hypothetical protein Tco_1482315 [Tanacetum coccineum]
MAGVDVDTLTMEQYLALSQENQEPGVVKPEIGGNVNFKIKSQFMHKLREDTFSRNKDEDAYDHIDRVLSIVGLFNIPRVSKDVVMLRLLSFTVLTYPEKGGWTNLPKNYQYLGSPQKAFIQRYCPPSMTAKQLEDIHNFKQEGDESLYQAWERYNDLLYKCPTHDINNHQKHDGMTRINIRSSSSNDGLAALVNKLDNLGRDMKKLKESVHAIQEVKQVKEVRYGEFRRTTPFNGNNGGKFHVGLPGYYTKIDNRSLYGKKRQSLEELLAKHQEESTRRSTEMEGLNKLLEWSFISGPESNTPEVLQHQLPPKELNPGSFTLPYTIDMSKKAPLGIVENVLVKIDKFLFPSNFVILENTPSETTILGRPFLATIHAEIDVFAGIISLGINEDRISFDTMRKDHNHTNPSEIFFKIRPQSPGQSNNQIDYEESWNWDNRSPYFDDRDPKK